MTYTVRFAHLEQAPALQVGQKILRGQLLGIMGSSGQSTAPHLHLDCVEGERTDAYTLVDIEAGDPKPAPVRQALFFMDAELFNIKPVITTHYGDVDYFMTRAKVHLGFDAVPMDRHASREHFRIRWPRSMPGRVVKILDDPAGYGHCLYVSFDV
jgi:hypothetical protein